MQRLPDYCRAPFYRVRRSLLLSFVLLLWGRKERRFSVEVCLRRATKRLHRLNIRTRRHKTCLGAAAEHVFACLMGGQTHDTGKRVRCKSGSDGPSLCGIPQAWNSLLLSERGYVRSTNTPYLYAVLRRTFDTLHHTAKHMRAPHTHTLLSQDKRSARALPRGPWAFSLLIAVRTGVPISNCCRSGGYVPLLSTETRLFCCCLLRAQGRHT